MPRHSHECANIPPAVSVAYWLADLAASEAGRAHVLQHSATCVKFLLETLQTVMRCPNKDLLWLILSIISNMAVEGEVRTIALLL